MKKALLNAILLVPGSADDAEHQQVYQPVMFLSDLVECYGKSAFINPD